NAYVAVENITRFVKNKGYKVDVEENGDEYTLNIRK
ncbi:MAG: preprotein translocase subunit TatB, partial [Tissierellia bacterium]|nr:preprotein translocase subunit TatB [Tissierellia bacterium]